MIFPSKISIQGQGLIQVSPSSAITGCPQSSCFLLPRGPEIRASSLGHPQPPGPWRCHLDCGHTMAAFPHRPHQFPVHWWWIFVTSFRMLPCSESRCKSKTLGYMNSQQKILRRLVPAQIYSGDAPPTQSFLRTLLHCGSAWPGLGQASPSQMVALLPAPLNSGPGAKFSKLKTVFQMYSKALEKK